MKIYLTFPSLYMNHDNASEISSSNIMTTFFKSKIYLYIFLRFLFLEKSKKQIFKKCNDKKHKTLLLYLFISVTREDWTLRSSIFSNSQKLYIYSWCFLT